MATEGQLQTSNDHSGINAIVIDDDIDVRELFVELLQMNNVNIVGIGSNGKDALELYKTHRPDLVFIDYLMPQYDGICGIKMINELDPRAKIIMVSGSYFGEGVLGDSVIGIIKKPIEMNEVIDMVNKIRTEKIVK